MGLNIKDAIKKGNGESVLARPDTHVARCYSVVDLGTHTETSAKYGTKTNRKLRLSFELPLETHTFKEEYGPQPLSVHKEYNFTLGEKATLAIDLARWFNKPVTPDTDLDLEKLLGKTCMVTVENKVSAAGRKYAKVNSVTSVPKGLTVPSAVNPTTYYDVTMGMQCPQFQSLPQFLQDRIASSEEFSPPSEDKDIDNLLQSIVVDEEETTEKLPY